MLPSSNKERLIAMKPLKTGMAYHGNRMPSHYRVDLEEMQKADLDIVIIVALAVGAKFHHYLLYN